MDIGDLSVESGDVGLDGYDSPVVSLIFDLQNIKFLLSLILECLVFFEGLFGLLLGVNVLPGLRFDHSLDRFNFRDSSSNLFLMSFRGLLQFNFPLFSDSGYFISQVSELLVLL